jgi:hypothetical protein
MAKAIAARLPGQNQSNLCMNLCMNKFGHCKKKFDRFAQSQTYRRMIKSKIDSN